MFRRHFGGGLTDKATLADFANVTMGQSPAGSSYNEAGIRTIFFKVAPNLAGVTPLRD